MSNYPHLRNCLVFIILFNIMVFAQQGPIKSDSQVGTFDWKNFHKNNDKKWASQTRLTEKDVRKLRLSAGIEDTEPSNPIDSITVHVLPQNEILFVTTAGSGHCLDVMVFKSYKNKYRKTWSVHASPDGEGFCHPALCPNPTVQATKKGEIEINVPINTGDEIGVCDSCVHYIYHRAGQSYELKESNSTPTRCYFGFSTLSLIAFRHSLGEPAPVVLLEVISQHPIYGISLQKRDTEFEVSTLHLPEHFINPLFSTQEHILPSKCIAMAREARIDKTTLSVDTSITDQLIAELEKINRKTDRCTREMNGQCAHILDGVRYQIQFQDGQIIKLTDTSNFANIRNENPDLFAWVRSLLTITKQKL